MQARNGCFFIFKTFFAFSRMIIVYFSDVLFLSSFCRSYFNQLLAVILYSVIRQLFLFYFFECIFVDNFINNSFLEYFVKFMNKFSADNKFAKQRILMKDNFIKSRTLLPTSFNSIFLTMFKKNLHN